MRQLLRKLIGMDEHAQQEIALRDQVIEALCYRYLVRNHQDLGHSSARNFALALIEQAQKGVLDPNLIPPEVRLTNLLRDAYYEVSGKRGLPIRNDETSLHLVLEDVGKAAQAVTADDEKRWPKEISFSIVPFGYTLRAKRTWLSPRNVTYECRGGVTGGGQCRAMFSCNPWEIPYDEFMNTIDRHMRDCH